MSFMWEMQYKMIMWLSASKVHWNENKSVKNSIVYFITLKWPNEYQSVSWMLASLSLWRKKTYQYDVITVAHSWMYIIIFCSLNWKNEENGEEYEQKII